MMKIKTQISVIVMLTIIIYGCGIRWNNSNIVKDTICSNYDSQISKLPMVLVEDMTDGYISKQKSAIDATHIMNDARAISFDLETLKQFIYHIENAAKNDARHPTSSDKLGIRIYYANYPSDSLWNKKEYDDKLMPFKNHSVKKNYGGLHTLVMIPTIRKDAIEMDFDPTKSSTYTNGLENTNTNSTQSISALTSLFMRTSQTSNNSSAQNHGNLYPPFGSNGLSF